MNNLKNVSLFKSLRMCYYTRKTNYRTFGACTESNSAIGSIQQKNAFDNALPKLMEVLLNGDIIKPIPEVQERLKLVVDNNVGGKKARGLITECAYESFEKPEKLTEKSMELARVAGWCVEMMQGFLVMTDDIIDNANMRRGSTCWFRRPDVGFMAISDACLLKAAYLDVIKLYFKDKPYYQRLLDLFNDTFLYTAIGQHIDCLSENTKDYKSFTIERYNKIVKYKTSYYSYNLPLAIGWVLTNNTDSETFRQIEELSIDLGQLFQVQDDYLDLYGEPSLTGKEGNDIQEGKCTWLAVTALENCTKNQSVVFKRCYGSKETAHYERIIELYNKLKIKEKFCEYENKQRNKIEGKIRKLPSALNPGFFMQVLNDMYQRKC